MAAVADETGIVLLDFVDRPGFGERLRALARHCLFTNRPHPYLDQLSQELTAYFLKGCMVVTVPLASVGTPFEQSVWHAVSQIPFGQTRTYQQIANEVGRPHAARAVGQANAHNWRAILIPCHRLVGSNGALTGYGGGIWRKRWLLEREGASIC
jgi:AraC family transcriptional regulator of adaptative response/methylated-DNA-[protein]-cysteine methyltransferase